MIRIVPCNSTAKDYICSDIHGHFSLVSQQLDHILNFPELESLICCEFNASQLTEAIDNLYSRGEIKKLPPVEAEQKWEFLIQAYRTGAEVKKIGSEDVVAAISFDISISPYLGVPFANKKGFYEWCLVRAARKA